MQKIKGDLGHEIAGSRVVDRKDLTLITIGGQVNPLVGAAVDGRALRKILGMRPDLLLLGIGAIDADEGLAAFYSEDTQMKSALLERSGSGIRIHWTRALTTEVEGPR